MNKYKEYHDIIDLVYRGQIIENNTIINFVTMHKRSINPFPRMPSFATDSSLIDDSINGHYTVLIPRSRKFLAEEGPSNEGDRCAQMGSAQLDICILISSKTWLRY